MTATVNQEERAARAEPVLRAMLDAFAHQHRLTRREHQVLEEAAGGLSNKEIAAQLGCSPKTVDVYWSRIFLKLRVRSRTAVICLVLRCFVGQFT
jgi:DNA-binding NarL/FixJ family response regulator